jgi:hypothetical protein
MHVGGEPEFHVQRRVAATGHAAGIRLQWAPQPLAEQRLAHGRWEVFVPEFRILAATTPTPAASDGQSELLRLKQEAFGAFRGSLPPDLAGAVERFKSHQWALLVLAHEAQSGSDLLRSNPVLAFALANNAFLQNRPMAAAAFQAVRYSHRKQREILKWLGFPATDAMVRLLHKIPREITHPGLLRKLRQAVALPDGIKGFSHLPALNAGVIYLACYPAMSALVTPKLIQEVAGTEDEQDAAPTADALQEIVILAKEMNILATVRPFSACRKVYEAHERMIVEHRTFMDQQAERAAEAARQVVAAHQRAVRRARIEAAAVRAREEAAVGTFPPPPTPGTDTIIPLTSFAALKEESKLQGNCVGRTTRYAACVVQGTHYIYRVLAPAHHTLCIGRRGHSLWVIEEFKGHRNARAQETARKMVQAWLYSHQVSL